MAVNLAILLARMGGSLIKQAAASGILDSRPTLPGAMTTRPARPPAIPARPAPVTTPPAVPLPPVGVTPVQPQPVQPAQPVNHFNQFGDMLGGAVSGLQGYLKNAPPEQLGGLMRAMGPLTTGVASVGGLPAIAGLLDFARGGSNMSTLMAGKPAYTPSPSVTPSTHDQINLPQEFGSGLQPNA